MKVTASAAVLLAALGFNLIEPALAQETNTQAGWMNASLSPDERADILLAQMTEDEELTLVVGWYGAAVDFPFARLAPGSIKAELPGTAGYVPGVERLGIPPLIETDASMGIANTNQMRPGDTATAFPAVIATAASFDSGMAFQVGAAIGAEARARGYNVVLDGSMNLAREPRGGRTFEYAGEDILLSGTTAGEEVRGIESNHIISTVKHFAFNDQETGRHVLSVNIDEAPLRESDLLAFEIAIEHGNPGAVMCAYNRVNTVYACENDFLLNRVLKHDWGYPGWVLSDWGGVHSTVASIAAGLDQESANTFDAADYLGAGLKQALVDRKVDPALLRAMVHRILRTMLAIGLIDHPEMKSPPDLAASAVVAGHDALESMVLLKNADSVLPLSRSVRSIALIGAHADAGMISGGGSSQVIPVGASPATEFPAGGAVVVLPNGTRIMPTAKYIFDPPSPLTALRNKTPSAVVRFAEGTDVKKAVDLARRSDVAIVFAVNWLTEGADQRSLSLPARQDDLIASIAAANPRTIVVLETGSPVLMPWLDKVNGVIEAWYAGGAGANALADILFGDANPSGHLPVTFPESESQLPNPVLPGSDVRGAAFDVSYPEGADVGYRWFEKQKLEPLFPFGFGLSYTHFALSNLEVSSDDTISASVDVSNDGAREGATVVQLYATPPDGIARLVGFVRADLNPGQTMRVAIPVEQRLLSRFDTDRSAWRMEKGDYTFAVGTSSAELAQKKILTLAARETKP